MELPEEETFIPAAMSYEENAWEGYHATLREHADPHGSREDHGAFLPDPDEVRARIGQMRWLAELGFDDRFMCSVMQYECPTIHLVRRMVKRYGVTETIRRLEPMLEKTEYDRELRGPSWE